MLFIEVRCFYRSTHVPLYRCGHFVLQFKQKLRDIKGPFATGNRFSPLQQYPPFNDVPDSTVQNKSLHESVESQSRLFFSPRKVNFVKKSKSIFEEKKHKNKKTNKHSDAEDFPGCQQSHGGSCTIITKPTKEKTMLVTMKVCRLIY